MQFFAFFFSIRATAGIGFGLILPSTYTAFNYYFDEKKNLMMSVCQAVMVACTIGWPVLIKTFMENYGFRGTVALIATISLHSLAAAFTLQPVEWHMIRKSVNDIELQKSRVKLRKYYF